MNNFQTELKTFVNNNSNLVSKKETAIPGLYILKYKNRVFYDDMWNRFLEDCRGTIVDEEFNVVTRPFTKIYNFGIEKRAPKLANDTQVTAYRKVNGFMVAMTYYQGELIVSTTGSTDSKFVNYAKEIMQLHAPLEQWKNAVHACFGATLMFECVHPEDPHIIPETPGMYFLGWRMNAWDSKVDGYGGNIAEVWKKFALSSLHCNYAESFETTIGQLVEESKKCRHEGYVFYTKDGISAKIKSPYYLVNKFVARNPNTDKLMKDNAKTFVDEEYYPLIDHIRSNIEHFTALTEQERLKFVRNFLETM